MPNFKKVARKSKRLIKAFPKITAKSLKSGARQIHSKIDLSNKRLLERFNRKR